MYKRLFYYCGIGAGIFYLIGDLIGGSITADYNYVENAVSELIQSGAENRILLSSLLFFHALMIILFSIGIMIHFPRKTSKPVFMGSILFFLVGLCHALSSIIFPQDPIGAEMTPLGIMHLIFVAVAVLSIIILMPLVGSGMQQFFKGKFFKTFSFCALVVIIIAGAATPVAMSTGIKTIGMMERITGYTFYIWMGALALLLIKREQNAIPNSI